MEEKLFSIEAEAGVLGSIIIDPTCISGLDLAEDDFYLPENKTIYSALMSLPQVDVVLLRTELNRRNKLEEVGGVEYIAEIMQSVPHSANAKYYAWVVREKKQYRDLVETIEKIKQVPDEPLTLAEQVQAVQDLALGIEADRAETEHHDTKCASSVIKDIETGEDTKLKTGLTDIDKIVGGLSTDDLVIIAARPSMGKTSLALNIALNVAKTGSSVIFFSLEMGYRSLIERAVGVLSGVNPQVLRADEPDLPKCGEVVVSAKELEELDIVFHENGTTPHRVESFIKQRKKTSGVDLVVIDYLQLMSAGCKTSNRTHEVTEISRRLKLLALKEQVPILCLSQLNRQVESRDGHRPRLSDLRDSGSIEQDADLVLLIHREDYFRRILNPENPVLDGFADVTVAKNRRGRTGFAKLVFIEDICKFGNLMVAEVFGESLI